MQGMCLAGCCCWGEACGAPGLQRGKMALRTVLEDHYKANFSCGLIAKNLIFIETCRVGIFYGGDSS